MDIFIYVHVCIYTGVERRFALEGFEKSEKPNLAGKEPPQRQGVGASVSAEALCSFHSDSK